tara:strand:- start:19 stop:210 length:192 start_codon:yes stop_codon:yes gene_type:complete
MVYSFPSNTELYRAPQSYAFLHSSTQLDKLFSTGKLHRYYAGVSVGKLQAKKTPRKWGLERAT